jgi:hypothetical protein
MTLLEEWYYNPDGEPVCLRVARTTSPGVFRVTRHLNASPVDLNAGTQRWPYVGPQHEALRTYLLWRRADLYVGSS